MSIATYHLIQQIIFALLKFDFTLVKVYFTLVNSQFWVFLLINITCNLIFWALLVMIRFCTLFFHDFTLDGPQNCAKMARNVTKPIRNEVFGHFINYVERKDTFSWNIWFKIHFWLLKNDQNFHFWWSVWPIFAMKSSL